MTVFDDVETRELWVEKVYMPSVAGTPDVLQFKNGGGTTQMQIDMTNTAIKLGSAEMSGSSLIADFLSSTRAVRIPVMSTTNRNNLAALQGMIILNSTTGKLNFYSGSGWEAVTSA